ncbi:NAD(P)/FAD-dependent oxidoreductase [Kineosporia babensis]|uniref:NAD(P)/FAD-dependent oxidoreductase n=1 Tax=Kineosporia babensis TaxID=499548 RepID=A0A9X1NI14_9ACTN|nr:NAD(P)/FAD-dependent oxidoreductase [Kineosporia babensis]MCD5313924.1 NAD(P)/FAD-dependent oxidoreductase [Kineosporia babensis]
MNDVIIIGGGAAGLSAALVLGRQQRQVVLVDSGRPRNTPATEMHMYLGRDGKPPAQLLADGRDEVAAHPNVSQVKGRVSAVAGSIDDFSVELEDGTRLQAARLLFTSGLSDIPIEIPGVTERWGVSVVHCPFCHGYESKGRSIAVLGGGGNAMMAAYIADRFSADVVLCTHGPADYPAAVGEALAARGVRVIETPVAGLEGETDSLKLTFDDGTVLDRQLVFHQAPTRPNTELAASLGCELLEDGAVKIDEFYATSVPGVFAAGDAAHLAAVPAPVTLVSAAAAGGVQAAVWMDMNLFRSRLPVELG